MSRPRLDESPRLPGRGLRRCLVLLSTWRSSAAGRQSSAAGSTIMVTRPSSRVRDAGGSALRQAGLMPTVIVYPPDEDGGRRVRVDGEILGRAFRLEDVVAFLQTAGLEGIDDLDVAGAGWIEWRGGGPDDWGR